MATPISITAANVIPSVDATYISGNTKSHEAFTAGQLAYLYAADGTYGLADANGSSETNTCVGIFVNSGGAGQQCKICDYDSNLVIGGAVVLGVIYIVGSTPGNINPSVDAATGWHVQYVCMALSATTVHFKPSPVCSSAIA